MIVGFRMIWRGVWGLLLDMISSNLERLLYLTAGAERTAAYMRSLNQMGVYTVDADVKSAIDASFKGYFADEEKTAATIQPDDFFQY